MAVKVGINGFGRIGRNIMRAAMGDSSIDIVAVNDLPRTRSNKLAELAVADVIHGREVRNKEALANPESLEFFRDLSELST